MNEQEALTIKLDEDFTQEAATLAETFRIPVRNWNSIVESYNSLNKKKFPFTSLQCKLLVEYVKKGIPPYYIFKTLGVTKQRYGTMMNNFVEMESRYEQLATKDELSEDEFVEFRKIANHPLRILLSDLERAEGAADLADWEKFNEHAATLSDFHLIKMKTKFKDIFSDKQQDAAGFNVQINLGGNWIEDV